MEAYSRHRPDIAVIDWRIGAERARTTVHALRQEAGTGHLPIMAMIAEDAPEGLLDVIESGVDDYVSVVDAPGDINARLRLLDFRLRAGDTERLHRHPAHVLYVLEGFEIEFTFADGSKGKRTAKAGDVLFSDPVAHSPINQGITDAHGILIELKNPSACPQPVR